MARNEQAYAGVWTAIVTPFHDDGRIDWQAFEALVARQVQGGVTGLVVAGTTGEAATLSVQEKLSLVRKAKVMVGESLLIMAGTGGQSTEQSVELSRLAMDAGADALLIVTPPYVKPNKAGLLGHFRAIAAQTKAPLCLYHVPGRTNQRLSAEDIAEICEDPYVTMVKEASGDIALFSESKILAKAMFLSGDDPTFLASLAVGGQGCISVTSNLFPQEMVSMQQHFMAGRFSAALAVHEALLPLINALFCETNPCPVKAALGHLGLLAPHFRLPLAPVSAAHSAFIATTLAATSQKLAALKG